MRRACARQGSAMNDSVPNVPAMPDDETIFPTGSAVQRQAQSRRAYHQLLAELDAFPWWQDYQELMQRGWDWRKAICIAWRASPASQRVPETQDELAKNVLGLTSDRVIAKWFKQNPEMDQEVVRMQAAPLLRHRRDIYDALVTVATMLDPKAHPDRKLALELMGDYKPRQVQELTGGDTPVSVKGALEHAIDADTAETIFGILAAIGAVEAGTGDAADDGVHSAEADGEAGGLPPAPAP